jgi:hypothetical protein
MTSKTWQRSAWWVIASVSGYRRRTNKPSHDEPLGDPRNVMPGDEPQARTADAERIQNYRDALRQIPTDNPAAEMFRLIHPDLLRDGTYPDSSVA